MKRIHFLPIIIVSVFILLCACTQETTPPPSSSTPTVESVPPTSPSTPPATEPTVPIQPSTDWMTVREIVPFEDRFEADVPFSSRSYAYLLGDIEWFAQGEDGSYEQYTLRKSPDTNRLVVFRGQPFSNDIVYEINVNKDLTGYTERIADGHWAYLVSSDALLKVDLTTGACTTLVTRNKYASLWRVQSCGKDTVCIFELDAENNLRISYQDLHSDAEKVLYEGAIPATPMKDLEFFAPETTLGKVSWQMMNPAFQAAVQKELQNSGSQFKTVGQGDYSDCWQDPQNHPVTIRTTPFLCIAIQNHYDIPVRVKYVYDIATGELLADYGIIDSCERGSGDYFDHFNYENTWETPLNILEPHPVDIPNITTLTEIQAEEVLKEGNRVAPSHTYLYSPFGYHHPYLYQDDKYIKVSDILVREAVSGHYYIYCINAENAIVQLSLDGSICNTIYTSRNTLADICYHAGSVYFRDGKEIIRIDTITGTYSPILRSDGRMGLDVFGSEDQLYILVVQGLYAQQYFFDPDTGVLSEESFI